MYISTIFFNNPLKLNVEAAFSFKRGFLFSIFHVITQNPKNKPQDKGSYTLPTIKITMGFMLFYICSSCSQTGDGKRNVSGLNITSHSRNSFSYSH